MSLSAGQSIRVAPPTPDGLSRRALILAFDGETHVELEYEGGEEAVVSLSLCAALLPFETESPPTDESSHARADRLKAQGNALFKLRDTASALENYIAALKCLQTDAPLSAGARCLIKPADGAGSNLLRSAMVLTVDDTSADVSYEPDAAAAASTGTDVARRLQSLVLMAEETAAMDEGGGSRSAPTPARERDVAEASSRSSWLGSWFSSTACDDDGDYEEEDNEDDEEEDDDEDGVSRDRIVLVAHGKQPALQCALLLNAAKCSMLAKDWPAALARALRAERLAANDATEPGKCRPHQRTALVVCARAQLGMSKFGKAITYAARLLAAAAREDGDAKAAAMKEVRVLLRDIQRRAVEVKRSNKMLAKALSEFVEQAMAASASEQPPGEALPLT